MKSRMFINWPDRIINLSYFPLTAENHPLSEFVISIKCSVLIGASRNLQIRGTWMESRMSSNTV